MSLLIGHTLVIRGDRARMADYADRLLQRSVEVADATTTALNSLHPQDVPCSEGDLFRLREFVFSSRLLRDVGRLVDDRRLLCSAAWGVQTLHVPLLSLPKLELNGIRFWPDMPNPANPSFRSDLAASGDTIVVTSPTAFDGFDALPARGGAKIMSEDGRHFFHAFGESDDLRLRASDNWYDLGPERYTRRCNDRFGLCVMVRKRHSGLFLDEPLLPVGLGLLGGLAGAGLGLSVLVYRRRQRMLPMQLRRALAHGRLTMNYQPLRALADGRLVGAEALVRWRNEQGDWVPPDLFVSLAEEMHLIGQLTRQVACKALAEMAGRLRGEDGFYLSLNLAVDDILDGDFHRYLHEQVAKNGIAPARVVLEITERTTAEHAELAGGINALRQLGYRFYVDDFGTGYSNLSSLAKLPIDAIKIDRMFIQHLGSESPINAIVEPICGIARQLRVGLVVEGIENEEQVNHLRHLVPAAIGQGWLLGRPEPIERFPAA